MNAKTQIAAVLTDEARLTRCPAARLSVTK